MKMAMLRRVYLPMCGLCFLDHSLFRTPSLATSLFWGVLATFYLGPFILQVLLLLLAAHPTPLSSSFPSNTLLSDSLLKHLAGTAPTAGLAPRAGMWLSW